MMKTLGERDFSAQETMHLLLSLKLHSSSFTVVPVSLHGSRKVNTSVGPAAKCTSNSLLDYYGKRKIYIEKVPDIMNINFMQFVSKYKIVKGELHHRSTRFVPKVFPKYSCNPRGENYALYCKYQLLKYRPWSNLPEEAWDISSPNGILSDPDPDIYINAWHSFLSTPYAQLHVPGICENIENAMEYVHVHEERSDKESDESGLNQEEWMLIADYHNLHNFEIDNVTTFQYDWQLDSNFYSHAQIDEMPNWVKRNKDDFETDLHGQPAGVDISCFSEMQKNAYDIIVPHCENTCRKNSLLMIINGVAGTGKRYLIAAVRDTLKDKCVITATTGKASFNISGVTIHSLLKLPVNYKYQKDLSGQSLAMLQDRLATTEYIVIDEYSMLGQKSFGWIDRRCRQATGLLQQIFGRKSIILIGDPGQLPPVGDKPLYHNKPITQLANKDIMLNKCLIKR